MSTLPNLPDLLGPSQQVFVGGEPEPDLLDVVKGLLQPTKPRMDDLVWQAESNLRFLQKKLSLLPKAVADAVQIDPTVMHGNPVFTGTRIPIHQIVEELADGTPFDELAEGYPSLDPEKIRLGLDFVASLLRIYDDEVPYR